MAIQTQPGPLAAVPGATEDPPEFDRLISKAEACRLLDVSYPTLWALVKVGKIAPGRYIKSRVYWKLSEIATFIEGLPRQARPGEQSSLCFPGAEAATAKRSRSARLNAEAGNTVTASS